MRPTRLAWWVGLAALLVAGGSIPSSGSTAAHEVPSSSPLAGSHGSVTPAASGTGGQVKPVNGGLMMRGPTPPPASLDSVIHGYIIEARWDVLQPTQDGPLDTSVIDQAVAAVRAWNAANPGNPRGLRLRVESGVYAPSWVKAMSGGPVRVSSPAGDTGTVPRWWTEPVEDAYGAFVSRLAAYTDPIPEIREVTVGATMEFFGEIFIRFPQQNAAALTAAGFTQAADIAALESSFRAYLAFKHTTTQIDLNAYQQVNGGGSLTVTQQLMEYALGLGLAHVQFANASLNMSGNDALYALMQQYGPRGDGAATITFQTLPEVGDVTAVLARALSFGATSVELPTNPGTAASLAPFDGALRSALQTR